MGIWIKFNGGSIPNGYEVRSFYHAGLMIRKIENEVLLNPEELYKAYKYLQIK